MRDERKTSDILDFKASALADDDAWHEKDPDFVAYDGDQLEREERAAMRRSGSEGWASWRDRLHHTDDTLVMEQRVAGC